MNKLKFYITILLYLSASCKEQQPEVKFYEHVVCYDYGQKVVDFTGIVSWNNYDYSRFSGYEKETGNYIQFHSSNYASCSSQVVGQVK